MKILHFWKNKFRRLGINLYIINGFLLFVPLLSYAEISVSQVLVLYNQDWTGDHPLTGKGQDSKEIADYYVKMNTDPVTGEKPYILGLSGKGEPFLNQSHLEENSHDNRSGVILTHLSKMIGSNHTLRDGRLVEFKLPKNESQWDLDTLMFYLGVKNSKISDRLTLIDKGKNLFPDRIILQPSKEFTVRMNGAGFLRGSFTAFVSCTDRQGKTSQWEADYNNISDVRMNHTGPDNVRDDKNYLEYVETPIKNFLEDPANATEEGRLLKDYILYFVISYGLPRTCIATYGIERGITSAPSNFGAMIDFGQRLQLMYYDFDQVVGITPRPYKFDTKEPFSACLFRAPQAYPLYGPKANPFVHPDIYNNKHKKKDLSKALAFTVKNRQENPARHLYFSMRLDGEDPLQAKALVDRSIYSKKYASPQMGVTPGRPIEQNKSATGSLKNNPAGQMFWGSGYKRIFYNYSAKNRLELFRLPPVAPFYNNSPVYLPGGIAATVISSSGWNRENSDLYKYLQAGVSVTAGAAHVYRGAPHIHNKSWWDDTVLYPAILNGKTVGEAMLMNQAHLEWITCFIGDPLLQLPEKPVEIPEKPEFENIDITLTRLPKSFGDRKTAICADLKTGNQYPKIAQMKARPEKNEAGMSYVCETFNAVPCVIVDNDIIDRYNHWTLSFIDPFGREMEKQMNTSEIN